VNLVQLGHFLAVVDAGSFTRAAAAVPMAQPSLSGSIRALERSLGTPLFDRSGGRARLTAAGEALVGPARQLQRDAALARSAVRAVAELEGGQLDVVALPGLAADPLAPLLGLFRTAHPAVVVRLLSGEEPADVVRAVLDGRAELGVTELGELDGVTDAGGRGGTGSDGGRRGGPVPDHPGLTTLALGHQELVVARRPPAEPWPGTLHHAAGEPIPRTALAGVDWVATPRGTSSRRLLEEAVGPAARVVVEAGARDALLALVASGAGAALVPRGAFGPRAFGWDCELVPVDPPIRRTVGLVRRSGRPSPAAAALLALALPAAVARVSAPRATP
jgi:LysR family transcriptional regulator, carnitine catabolism transcriptional activator